MIYQYDQALQLPTVDLYDTQMMAMALNAAKDMYEKGEQQIKDFQKAYGDFDTPFQRDMERYNTMVNGVRNMINDLYASGQDPLRSAIGRAKVAQAIRSVNPAEMAAMKANAKMGYAYLEAMQKLRSQGKYSEAQEMFDIMNNGGTKFQDFVTIGPNGFNSWDRTSPIEATTLRDLTYDSYKNRTARALTADDFKDPRLAGYKYDPRYQWTGYLDSDLMKVAPGASLSLVGDTRADFFREQAKQKVIASGKEPTAAAIEAQFRRDIADANSWALIDPTKKADEFALDNYRTANDIAAYKAKAATDYQYKLKEAADPRLSSGNGKGKNTFNPNIFREAEALTPKENPAHTPLGQNAGMHVGYVPSGQYEELIDPVVPATYVESKDKDSGQMLQTYVFNTSAIENNVYLIDQNGKIRKSSIIQNNEGGADDEHISTKFTFIPDGQMKAARYRSGYKYYISGEMRGNNPEANDLYNTEDGSTQVWIEVKERGYNYDGKKK